MCSTTRCARCTKTTWRGCGAHVEAVLARVPHAERCACVREPRTPFLQRLLQR